VKAYAELGSELRTAREKAGRSISEVASETGLPERYVVALEQGDMADLPDLSYARLYLQSYARSLRLDPESMLAAWPATRPNVPETGLREEPGSRTKPRWPLYAAGLFLLIIVGLVLMNRESTVPPPDPRASQTPERQPAQLPGSPPTPVAATSTDAFTPVDATTDDVSSSQEAHTVSPNLLESQPTASPSNAGRADLSTAQPLTDAGTVPVSPFVEAEDVPVTLRTLDVVVAAQTWLVIEADGDTVVARVALRGEKVSAEARSDFRLTVANPRDLQVQLDGRPLELSIRSNRPLIRHLLPGKDTP